LEATAVWPFYWGRNKKGRWHVGQFPPMLTLAEWKKMFAELEAAKPTKEVAAK
jgi:hypothetical protein